MRLLVTFIILFSYQLLAREPGQTEITTEEGIEVFKQEKYYILKKNDKIISDEFELKADLVKAYFDKDLYDIIKINTEGNANLESNNNIKASGEKININIRSWS